MKMYFGNTWDFKVDEKHKLHLNVCPDKWFTTINMSLWEDGNSVALYTDTKRYFNYNKIIPMTWAESLAKRDINKQSMAIAGIKIIK